LFSQSKAQYQHQARAARELLLEHSTRSPRAAPGGIDYAGCLKTDERHQSWPKYEKTNDRCAYRRYKHSSCGHVFGLSSERVELGRSHVCEELKGSIQSFGCPDRDDCKTNPAPLISPEAKAKATHHNQYGCGCVHPGVVLGADHCPNSLQGAPDASDSATATQVRAVVVYCRAMTVSF